MLAGGAALALPTLPAVAAVELDAELVALGGALTVAWAEEKSVLAKYEHNTSAEAEAAIDAIFAVTSALVDRIEQVTAKTLAGLRVKALALAWTHDDQEITPDNLGADGHPSTDLRLIADILRDLRTIG